MNEFNKARNDDTIVKPEENSVDYENEDLQLSELRNSCVSKTEYSYSNAHFSAAIKECQELTDELRVSKNNITHENVWTKHFLNRFFFIEIHQTNRQI